MATKGVKDANNKPVKRPKKPELATVSVHSTETKSTDTMTTSDLSCLAHRRVERKCTCVCLCVC